MTTSTHTPPARPRHAPVGPRGISVHGNRGIKVVRACTVLRPARELYAFCRRMEDLPRVLGPDVTISPINGLEAHWTVRVPVGGHWIEWDMTLINDEPDRLLAWRSLEGAPIPNAGTIRFEPARDGFDNEVTVVTVQMEYDLPGGALSEFFSRLSGDDPEHLVAEALRRFKILMETGESSRITSRYWE